MKLRKRRRFTGRLNLHLFGCLRTAHWNANPKITNEIFQVPFCSASCLVFTFFSKLEEVQHLDISHTRPKSLFWRTQFGVSIENFFVTNQDEIINGSETRENQQPELPHTRGSKITETNWCGFCLTHVCSSSFVKPATVFSRLLGGSVTPKVAFIKQFLIGRCLNLRQYQVHILV